MSTLRVFLTASSRGLTEHKCGEKLAAFALRTAFGESPPLIRDARGKPFVQGGRYFISISNSRGICAAAVSDRLVGVDIERKPTDLSDANRVYAGRTDNQLILLAERWFYPDETDYVRADPQERFPYVWTAKESLVKLTGDGLSGFSLYPSVFSDDKHEYLRFDDSLVFGCVCVNKRSGAAFAPAFSKEHSDIDKIGGKSFDNIHAEFVDIDEIVGL